MDFPEPTDVIASVPEEAEPFWGLPEHFTEDELRLLGIEMPTEWDNALLDQWVDVDLLFDGDLMDGVEEETSAAVAGSPDLIGSTGIWPQESLSDGTETHVNRGVLDDTRYEVPERNNPHVNNQAEATQARRRINDAEWDDQRPHITFLYIDKGNSLTQTRAKMADDYGFYASETAYKDKIREWRLVKNLKRRQIVYMLKTARKRMDEQGKGTTFFYHGNRVPDARLRRYSNTMTTNSTIGTVPSNITYVTTTDSQIPNTQHQQRNSRRLQARTNSVVSGSLSPPLSRQAVHGLDKDRLPFLNLKRTIVEAYEARDDGEELIERHGGNVSTALEHLRISRLEEKGSTPASLAELAKFSLSPAFVKEVTVIQKNWYSADRRLFVMPLQTWQAQCLIAARRFSEGEVVLDTVLQEYEHTEFTSEEARLEKIAPLSMLLAKAYLAQQKFYTLERMLSSVVQRMDELDDLRVGELTGQKLSLRKMLYVCRIFQLKALNNSAEPQDWFSANWKDVFKWDATLAKNLVRFEDENPQHNDALWALSMLDVLRYVRSRRSQQNNIHLASVLRRMEDVALSRPIAALMDIAASAGDSRPPDHADLSQVCSIFSRMFDSQRLLGTLGQDLNWQLSRRNYKLIYTPPDATLENLSDIDYAMRIMGPLFKRFVEGWPPIELPDIAEARRTSFPFPPSESC